MGLPDIGTRLILAGQRGTVRFVGPVAGTQGTWLGVEWDDPRRGKHDGVKDGKRYFSCIVPGAGSFIRPNASIFYGQPFLTALASRYVESAHGGHAQETVVLGSSNGAIAVEAVGLDNIRRTLARLESLREVSLVDEAVATPDAPGKIRSTCPDVRGLDLSASLLPSWDAVAQIACELPLLERLALNRTRLQPPRDRDLALSAFRGLRELQLSGTLMSWVEMSAVIQFMPLLVYVEMGFNRLDRLSPLDPPASQPRADRPSGSSTLATLNLDSNELHDWPDITCAARPFTALQRIILTANRLAHIPPFAPAHNGSGHHSLPDVRHLCLTGNALGAWSAIDNLNAWLPRLETLRLAENPLCEDPERARYYRQFVIAKLPALAALDSTQITSKERRNCELFYLSYISRTGPASEDERCSEHPRWKDLCDKWGRPDEAPRRQDGQGKLSSQLIQLVVHPCASPPSTASGTVSETGASVPVKALRTMTLRTFRLKVLKTLKYRRPAGLPADAVRVRVWLKMRDDDLVELDAGHDSVEDLTWWGLEDGSEIYLHIEQ